MFNIINKLGSGNVPKKPLKTVKKYNIYLITDEIFENVEYENIDMYIKFNFQNSIYRVPWYNIKYIREKK